MNLKFKDLTERNFLEKYLLIYNLSVSPEKRLVKSEMELVIAFALLPQKFEHSRFSSIAKSKVVEALTKDSPPTKASINCKIYDLIEKGFLIRDEDKVIYMPKHFIQALSEFRRDKLFIVNIQLCSSQS